MNPNVPYSAITQSESELHHEFELTPGKKINTILNKYGSAKNNYQTLIRF